jgi:hypothetical protein
MSTLAVFLVLGGTAAAVTTINGRDIKRRSVTGSKLAPNTLTGRQIAESKLGRVRNARNATLLAGVPAPGYLRATGKAADADRLDGLDSTAFVKGAGTTVDRRSASIPATDGSSLTPLISLPLLGDVGAACSDGGQHVVVRYRSTTLANQFVTLDQTPAAGPQPTASVLAPGANVDATATGTTSGLDAHLTVVRDAPSANGTQIDIGAVTQPGGQPRCIVSVTAVSGG